MNKEKYLCNKVAASSTLFEHPGVSYLDRQDEYEKRNFESTERLVQILEGQSKIRGTQHIFHRLHTLRNL